jgi:hypothetical protein
MKFKLILLVFSTLTFKNVYAGHCQYSLTDKTTNSTIFDVIGKTVKYSEYSNCVGYFCSKSNVKDTSAGWEIEIEIQSEKASLSTNQQLLRTLTILIDPNKNRHILQAHSHSESVYSSFSNEEFGISVNCSKYQD